MKIKKITDQHLTNRIAYFKRFLGKRPLEANYMGDSPCAEDAVNCENRQNEILAGEIEKHIREMEIELKHRSGLRN